VTEVHDDELLREVDDDIVVSRNAPPRLGSGWGKPWIVGAILVGVVFGAWMAARSSSSEPTDLTSTSVETTSSMSEEEMVLRMSELQEYLAENPDDVDALLEMGVLQMRIGNLELARSHWERVTNLDPTNAKAWYNLGFYYIALEPPDYINAERVWNKVIELDPDSELAASVRKHLEQFNQTGSTPTDAETGG